MIFNLQIACDGRNVAIAAGRRVDDASSVHRSAIAMVDEKSVIHPTAASALLPSIRR
jgi:hypothetical protein